MRHKEGAKRACQRLLASFLPNQSIERESHGPNASMIRCCLKAKRTSLLAVSYFASLVLGVTYSNIFATMRFARIAVALVLLLRLASKDVTAEEDGTSTKNNGAAVATTKRQRRRLRRRNKQIHGHHRHAAVSTGTSTRTAAKDDSVPSHLLSHRIVLVRGAGTSLCWTVDNGRYNAGTLIVSSFSCAWRPRMSQQKRTAQAQRTMAPLWRRQSVNVAG